MKKIIVMIMSVILCFSLAACGGGGEEKPAEEPAEKTVDLTGTWTQVNSNSEDAYQEATIADGTIEINWITDGGDTKSLYWLGTADVPENKSEFAWTSQGNVEEMASALLASQDETKEITYKDGVISYEASMMGTTTTVKLEKK